MPVNTKHPDYNKKADKWQRCRDAAEGQDAIHAAGERYLPKLKHQKDDDYKAYVQRATFTNYTWRTISGLVGMLFRKPPTITGMEAFDQWMQHVDGIGRPLSVFANQVCEDALEVGRIGVLVDRPPTPPNATKADAVSLNLEPKLSIYKTESILNWRTALVNNKITTTMAVLQECEYTTDDKDEFSQKEETRYRVLDLLEGKYRQRIFLRKDEKDVQVGADIYPTMNGATMDFIPFICIGVDDLQMEPDDPPMIDLVDLNLSHYRTMADYAHGCHFTGLPMLFLAGVRSPEGKSGPSKIYVGSEEAIVSTNPDATAKYVEFSGAGLSTLENKLSREEQQMAILGARMLEPQKKAAETSEASSIHRKGEESMLAMVAGVISLGLTQALRWVAQWEGATELDNIVYELNRDFYPSPMEPGMITALLAGWQQGAPGLSDRGLFDALKAGEVIAHDADFETEQQLISDQQQRNIDQQVAAQKAMADLAQQQSPDKDQQNVG